MPDIQTLVQGGAVSISLCCLYIIYKMQNGQRRSFIDALDKNSEAITANATALQRLTDTVDFKIKRRRK